MNHSETLRRELINRAESYVRNHGLEQYVYRSTGKPSVVLFKSYEVKGELRHGTFYQDSYVEILKCTHWHQRLFKRHSQLRALQTEDRSCAREMDSCTSSDALLMNIFCHPSVLHNQALAELFGLRTLPKPGFGFHAHLLKKGDRTEKRSTEIDMALFGESTAGDPHIKVFVESKLTEKDFTSKKVSKVEAYRDFSEVLESTSLRQQKGEYVSYQLLRNVLAAHDYKGWFYLVHDERRPDLKMALEIVLAAVKLPELRDRCRALTWQQIAATLPQELQGFLKEKYGIC